MNTFEDNLNNVMMKFNPDLNNYLDLIRITMDVELMD